MTIVRKGRSAAEALQEDLQRRDRARRHSRAAAAHLASSAPPPRSDLAPDCPLVRRRIDGLRSAGRKVRKTSEAQLARVEASFKTFGVVTPILISRDGTIIDGHSRFEAAKRLGLTEIPCLVVDHLTPTEITALKITLNRTAETGEWDMDALAIDLGDLALEGFPLELTGFSLQQIDGLTTDDAFDEEQAPEAGPSVSRAGDVWVLGPHKVICGDARDPQTYAELMQRERARLVLTDEPYNVPIAGHVTSGNHREFAMASGEMTPAEFAAFNAAWMEPAAAAVMDGGLFGTFIDWRSVDVVIGTSKALGLVLLNLIVWEKTNAGMGSLWRSQHELLPMFKKGAAPHVNNVELGKHGRYRSNVWTYAGANTMGSDAKKMLADHPTPKPVLMLEDALRDVTKPGEIVLDPFLGSGSMLIAAERTGRVCRGIELDPVYADLAVRRWQAATGQVAVLDGTTDAFDDVGAHRIQSAAPQDGGR